MKLNVRGEETNARRKGRNEERVRGQVKSRQKGDDVWVRFEYLRVGTVEQRVSRVGVISRR